MTTEKKESLAGTTYQAVEVYEKGKLRLTERKIPALKPLQVLIKIALCGVCHGDVLGVQGTYHGHKFPVVPGHEIVGTVVEVGSEVTRFKVGERVARGWHDPCMSGDFLGCKKKTINTDGGYGQYLVCNFESVARYPDSLSFEHGVCLTCGGLTCYNAIRKTGAVAGDIVAIQGIGGLGHMGLQIARKMGFEVVAISSGPAKEKEAREFGAHHYLDASAVNVVQELQKLGGARVIMATAFDSKAISSLVEGLAPKGELLVAGADHHPLTITPLQLIAARRKIVGCASGSAKDNEECLKFSAIAGVKNVIELYPLDKFQEAYDRMLSNKQRYRVVINPWALSTDKPATAEAGAAAAAAKA